MRCGMHPRYVKICHDQQIEYQKRDQALDEFGGASLACVTICTNMSMVCLFIVKWRRVRSIIWTGVRGIILTEQRKGPPDDLARLRLIRDPWNIGTSARIGPPEPITFIRKKKNSRMRGRQDGILDCDFKFLNLVIHPNENACRHHSTGHDVARTASPSKSIPERV